MTEQERRRWDERYASGAYVPRARPTPFLLDRLDDIPRGRALDIATGTGRNALALAEAGFTVDAVDISAVALRTAAEQARVRDLDVTWTVADLDHDPFPGDRYELITVIRYRNPALWPRLIDTLAPDGWLLVEHHLRTERADVEGPGDPAFRLAPGELLASFASLRIVHYSEQVEPTDDGSGHYVIARMAACAGDPGW
ncbi:MAG: class I SAM-dependent methyltransferase [Nitriliruptoraceae bacterium]|nr:class I SAM-dependent methyltransferase [Nitriliruptoraceae bacterium]